MLLAPGVSVSVVGSMEVMLLLAGVTVRRGVRVCVCVCAGRPFVCVRLCVRVHERGCERVRVPPPQLPRA